MAYLICTGADGTSSRTKSGIKSRGYHIYRRGRVVHTWWGPFETRRGQSLAHFGARKWLGKPFKFRTEAAARDYLKARIAKLKSVAGGYRNAGRSIKYRRGELRV